MANYKSGEVSWTDTVFDASKKGNSKDSFLRLSPGSNIVRLLTLPHQYHQHKHLIEGGKKFGYRINCSGAHGSCPICEKSTDKAKRRWYLGVIDRKSNTYKILDIGFAVFKAIQTLAKDDDWGDPSRYDVDIVVDPNGGSTGYYTVVAKPPKPLSAGDLVIREDNDPEALVRRATPPTPDKVLEKLQSIMEEINSGGHTATAATTTTASTDSNDEEGGDDENYFKNYSGDKKAPF
jgi:hypothetical protein